MPSITNNANRVGVLLTVSIVLITPTVLTASAISPSHNVHSGKPIFHIDLLNVLAIHERENVSRRENGSHIYTHSEENERSRPCKSIVG